MPVAHRAPHHSLSYPSHGFWLSDHLKRVLRRLLLCTYFFLWHILGPFGTSVTLTYGDKDANRIVWLGGEGGKIAKLFRVTMVMKKKMQRLLRGWPNFHFQ